MSVNQSVDQNNKSRNYTLFILVLIYASSHIDRQIVSILAESIKLDLGLSDSQLGFLIGLSFAIFYATLGIPIALLADRMNRRNIIGVSVIIWSGMTALSGMAANFTQLALARIGVGIGEAGSTPPSHSMISDLFPLEQRAAAMGIFSSGINLGILVGFLVGGWIDHIYGWRTAFYIVGIPGIFLGLILFLTVKEPARTHSRAKQAEGRSLDETAKGLVQEIYSCVSLMLKIPSQRHILIGCTLVVFVGYGTVYWNGVYFRRILGLSPAEAGTLLALVGGIIGGIGTFFGGWLADRLARRDQRFYVWLTGAVKVFLIPLVILFYLSSDLMLITAVICVLSFFGGFYLPSSFAMTQSLMPPHMRALASAILLFTINIIGLGLGPYLVGVLSDVLRPEYGQDGLRYALLSVSLLNIWGGTHYFLAARTIRADLAVHNS
jgi:MFS family permease